MVFSLFRKPKVKNSKRVVGGLLASTIEHVIAAQGAGALLAGTLSLNERLHPSFYGGPLSRNEGYIAVVAVADLKEVGFLKLIVDGGVDIPIPSFVVDNMVRAAMIEFSAQSQEFRDLPFL
jgi:hypothetical protein